MLSTLSTAKRRYVAVAAAIAAASGASLGIAPSANAAVGCQAGASIDPSETYGTISHFGGLCAAGLEAKVTATLYRNGVAIASDSTHCSRTRSGVWCEDYILRSDPAGTQTYVLNVAVSYRFDSKDWWKVSRTSVTRRL